MSQRVPNWDLDECPDSSRIHPPDHNSSKPPLAPRLGYEVAELTWENGQLSMHGLGQRRSTDKNLSKCNWEKSPAEDTLECVVNQASRIISLPTVNYQATDALVPSAGSGLPDKTDSGKQLTVDDHDSVCHGRSQREDGEEDGKKKVQTARSSSSTKRTRAAAIHNQSERKRRDRINEKMKALQKLVPNSSKTDKASMLDEVIEYLKQLKAQVQMMSRMNNMSHMMIPMTMQQFQMAMMAQMQMSMGMNMGMGMNLMDMNSISRQALAGVTGTGISPTIHPTAFLPFPASWENPNDRSSQQLQQQDVYSNFLGCQMQPMNMDAYTRMAALYQQLHQSSPQVPNTTKD